MQIELTWKSSARRGGRRPGLAVGLGARPSTRLGAEIVEHVKTDRRRQVALLAALVDLADEVRQRHAARRRDFLHADPERFLETYTGLVTSHHDRTLHHRRLHRSPSPMRC